MQFVDAARFCTNLLSEPRLITEAPEACDGRRPPFDITENGPASRPLPVRVLTVLRAISPAFVVFRDFRDFGHFEGRPL